MTKQVKQFAINSNTIYNLVLAQAGTLGKALLETIMNSVDAEASKVDIELTQTRVRISDDGRGLTTADELELYFAQFGFDHATDALQSKRVYGQFGIGRAQLWAFTPNTWRTGEFLLDVNIRERGLEYLQESGLPFHQGVEICGSFYEPLSARELLTAEAELKELAKYIPIPVTLNGTVISTNPEKVKWTHETDDAWIRIKETGGFSVYNQGAFVRHYPSFQFGCGGEVVTKPGVRLSLNMARNDILLSQCATWKRIRPYIQARADDANKTRRATAGEVEAARQNYANRLRSGEVPKDWNSVHVEKLITDVRGKHMSIATAVSHVSGMWALAPSRKDPRGCKVADGDGCFVVSPETLSRFGVETLGELWAVLLGILDDSHYRETRDSAKSLRVFETLDAAGCKVNSDYRLIDNKELTADEKLTMSALNYMNKYVRFAVANMLGRDMWTGLTERTLRVGVSGTAQAWTDGDRYIAIERSLLSQAKRGLEGHAKLMMVLVHEYLHDANSAGSHVHNEEFYENFHDVMLSHNGCRLAPLMMRRYVAECLKKKVTLVRKVADSFDDLSLERTDSDEMPALNEPAPEAPLPKAGRNRPIMEVAKGKETANRDLFDDAA